MAPKKNGAAATEEHPAGSALATTTTHVPAVANEATENFQAFYEQLEEFLETGFAQKKSLARSGAPFTLLAISDRLATTDEGKQEAQWVYQVRVDGDYVMENKDGVKTAVPAGSEQLITLGKSNMRDKVTEVLRAQLDEHGHIPGLAMQEFPTTDPKRSNPFGIVPHSKWKTVAEVAAERAAKKHGSA